MKEIEMGSIDFLVKVAKFGASDKYPGSLEAIDELGKRAKSSAPNVVSRPHESDSCQKAWQCRAPFNFESAKQPGSCAEKVEFFEKDLDRLCKEHGIELEIGSCAVSDVDAGFKWLEPWQLARKGGSWSYVVEDDGKCAPIHLERIAEINGFRLLAKDKPFPFVVKVEPCKPSYPFEIKINRSAIDDLNEAVSRLRKGSASNSWLTIETWINNEPNATIEIRRPGVRNNVRQWSVILNVRESRVGEIRTFSTRSKAFRGDTRDRALGLAAAFLSAGGFPK